MVSITGSKARHRSRKTPTPKQAFAGPPGSSRSSAAGTDIHPRGRPARSPSRMVFSASMLLLMVGASEMCACPSAFAGTTADGSVDHSPVHRHVLRLQELHQPLVRAFA